MLCAAAAMASVVSSATGQTAFTDSFSRTDVNTSTTTPSTVIGNGWSFNSDFQNPARGGAQIINNLLMIGQGTAGGYAGGGGSDRSWLWQDSSTWATPYTSTLKNNTKPVSWTFNMRAGQSNPTPFSTSGGGTVAVYLATAEPGSGDWMFGANAKGYFVTYNSSGTGDPLRLMRTSAGLRQDGSNSTTNLHTQIIAADAAPFNDLSSQFLSVKVTYDPASDQWKLYARDDGGSFQDPATGNMTFLGSAVDNTWVTTPLPYSGFAANNNNGQNGGADEGTFDNFTVSAITQVQTPDFTPGGGTYGDVQNVVITATPSAATIRYTVDGSTPTPTTGILYTGPVAIGPATTTINAIAYTAGLTDSAVRSETYQFQVSSLVFAPAPGTYPNTQNVTITTATPGAAIYYTTNGDEPDINSTLYTGTPVPITAQSTLLKAAAVRSGFTTSTASGTYILKAGTPVFAPVGGTYNDVQNVTLTSSTTGAEIRYTTDGSDPTPTTGILYTGPFAVSTSTFVIAIASKSGFESSDLAYADYVLKTANPTFSPAPATYGSTQSVTIASATPGAIIRYTTDDNAALDSGDTNSGTLYTGPVTISQSANLRAFAYKGTVPPSDVVTGEYFIQAATPVFNPPAWTYATAQNVTITTSTTGSTIHFTTDGSVPTTSSPIYSSPIPVSVTTTIRAIAVKAGVTNSPVAEGPFEINTSSAVVFDDAFTDGGRTDGSDTRDGRWWVFSNSAPSTKDVNLDGKFEIGRSGTNGNGFNPGAVTTFPAQTLQVGQKIELAFDFSSTSTTASATGLRFGLYNSGGNGMSTDLVGNPPGTGNLFNNDIGFSVFAPSRGTGTQNVGIYYRSVNNTVNNLQVSTAANAVIATSGLATPTVAGTTYNSSLSIERLTTTSYKLIATYAGVTVTLPSYTPAAATNVFDSLSVFSIHNANLAYEALFLDNLKVTITSTAPPAGPLATWRTLQGLPADGSQDGANPSGDGVKNLMKYALNLAPSAGDLALSKNRPLSNPDGTTVAELTGLPVLRLNSTPASVFTYIRRKSSTSPGITYTVQWSDELGAWAGNPSATETTLSLDATWERVQLTDSFNTSQKPVRFARLIVATP